MNDFICLSFFVQFLWINFGEWLGLSADVKISSCGAVKYLQHAYAEFTYAKIFIFYRFSVWDEAGENSTRNRTHGEMTKLSGGSLKFDKPDVTIWGAPSRGRRISSEEKSFSLGINNLILWGHCNDITSTLNFHAEE